VGEKVEGREKVRSETGKEMKRKAAALPGEERREVRERWDGRERVRVRAGRRARGHNEAGSEFWCRSFSNLPLLLRIGRKFDFPRLDPTKVVEVRRAA
jgi:hypothetical protein